MKLAVATGTTDYTVVVFIQDSSATDGSGLTGLDDTKVDGYYYRVNTDNDIEKGDVGIADLTTITDAHSDGGFIAVDGTNLPGFYRVDLPDALFASGNWSSGVRLYDAGSNNVADCVLEFQLISPTRGLAGTALPDAAADDVGGLPISDAGGLDMDAIKTKTDYLPSATAGSAGGVFIAGSNAATSITTALTANITGNLSGSVGSLTTNNDKTGYEMAGFKNTLDELNDLSAAAAADAVWDELATGHTDAGKAGEQLWTDVDAILADTNELQTDDVPTLIAALPTAADAADAVLDEVLAEHTLGGSLGKYVADTFDDTNELQTDDVPGLIAALNDPTAATIADAVWDEAATGHTDAGKAGAQLWTDIDAILVDTDELQTDDVPGLIAALNDPTAAAIADQVWEEAIADHSGTGGSTAEALAAASGVGDPWSTALPGAYGAGTAGYIVGNNLDASVADVETDTQDIQSRLPAALVSGRMSSDAVAISGSTTAADNVEANIGNLDASISGLNDPTAAAIADQVWEEAIADHSGTAGSTAEALDTAGSGGDATAANQTTIITHLTDVKGTGFVKDTHSLTDIEGYVDLIDDGTSGLAKIAADVAAILVDTGTTLNDKIDTIDGIVDDILADTGEMQVDLADGGRLDLLIDAIKAETDKLDSAHAEPADAPDANETPLDKLGYLFMTLRNKVTVSSSAKTIFDDDGNELFSKTLSDDGTTYTETEAA